MRTRWVQEEEEEEEEELRFGVLRFCGLLSRALEMTWCHVMKRQTFLCRPFID